jgi:hypothetical protein
LAENRPRISKHRAGRPPATKESEMEMTERTRTSSRVYTVDGGIVERVGNWFHAYTSEGQAVGTCTTKAKAVALLAYLAAVRDFYRRQADHDARRRCPAETNLAGAPSTARLVGTRRRWSLSAATILHAGCAAVAGRSSRRGCSGCAARRGDGARQHHRQGRPLRARCSHGSATAN